MKKHFLALFAAAAFIGTASSQVTFGPMAGLIYSSVSDKVDPEPDGYESEPMSGIGFAIGGFANIELSDNFAFRPEVQFQSRGTKSDFSETTEVPFIGEVTSEGETKSSDSFLVIPLLANLMLSENINVHVGPSIGLLMGSSGESEVTTTIGGESTTETVEFDGTDGRNGFELGLSVGAAFETEGGLGFGIRLTPTFTDIKEETEFGDTTFKNKYFVGQFNITYTLGK